MTLMYLYAVDNRVPCRGADCSRNRSAYFPVHIFDDILNAVVLVKYGKSAVTFRHGMRAYNMDIHVFAHFLDLLGNHYYIAVVRKKDYIVRHKAVYHIYEVVDRYIVGLSAVNDAARSKTHKKLAYARTVGDRDNGAFLLILQHGFLMLNCHIFYFDLDKLTELMTVF